MNIAIVALAAILVMAVFDSYFCVQFAMILIIKKGKANWLPVYFKAMNWPAVRLRVFPAIVCAACFASITVFHGPLPIAAAALSFGWYLYALWSSLTIAVQLAGSFTESEQ